VEREQLPHGQDGHALGGEQRQQHRTRRRSEPLIAIRAAGGVTAAGWPGAGSGRADGR
jgi:hypothetical protein